MLTAIGVAAAIPPSVTQAAFPGADGVVAYSDVNGIWAVDPATGYQSRLTSGPDDSRPAFSASGSLLAFQRGYGTEATVYVAAADGETPQPIVKGAEPSFSPDGRKVVFSTPDGLDVANVSDHRTRRLTRHGGDHNPRWSVAGVIAYEAMHTVPSQSKRTPLIVLR